MAAAMWARHWLRVTTTRGERLAELAPLADAVQLLDAADPDQLREALAWPVEQGFDGLINLVDDEPISVRELIDRCCHAAGLAPVI
ncbi:hypothetical protein [Synechococcus sp. RedBA-s]|uniref:hypothetical protein n=1 Tax=Synechococcus sp. RedBA-s TaxID=2823741 RepID=UPI0020CE0DB1|nr:hypothetical protein [Synechococcus sp. RedBA-s]MCP9800792.1 hypothetical protein [Synechococcus sp. RedBA-s]